MKQHIKYLTFKKIHPTLKRENPDQIVQTFATPWSYIVMVDQCVIILVPVTVTSILGRDRTATKAPKENVWAKQMVMDACERIITFTLP